ncbi:hypothetical protein SEEPBA42_00540, partial [Salmonella enterica subsp. enterica serovar Paratyphi B str. SARA42]
QGLKIPVSLVRFRVRAPLIQKTQPMAGFLLFWEWKSVAPISGLTSYNEKARFSLAQRPALRRSAAHLWAWVKSLLSYKEIITSNNAYHFI